MNYKNIIKKLLATVGTIIITCVALKLLGKGLLFLFLYKTGIGGAGDWSFDQIPGEYEIWRFNAYQVELVKREDEDDVSRVVGPWIVAFCWDENHIGMQQIPDWEEGVYDPDKIVYYIINTNTGELYGPVCEAEYTDLCNMIQTDFCEWISTASAPAGSKK